MQVTSGVISTDDGRMLPATIYKNVAAKAVLLIGPASGVQQRFYEPFARVAVSAGFTVFTFDYRGNDSLKTARQVVEPHSLLDWGRCDLPAAIEAAAYLAGDTPLYYVGHSISGQIIGLAHNHHKLHAILGYGNAHGYYKNYPQERQEYLHNYWAELLPKAVKEHGYFPGSRHGLLDLTANAALEWARWCLSPHYFCTSDGEPIRDYFDSVRQPMQLLAAVDDDMAPPSTVSALADMYSASDALLDVISPDDFACQKIGHFDYLRNPAFQDDWGRRLEWLRAQ